MGNTLDSGIKRVSIANMALEAFANKLAPLSAFSTDYSDEVAEQGDGVTVKYIPAAAAAQTFNGTVTVQDSTMSKKTVTLGAPVYVTWHLSDTDRLNSAVDIRDFAIQKGNTLGDAVVSAILANVTATNYGAAAFTGDATGFDTSDVIDIKDACDTAKMPADGRSLVLGTSYYNSLLKDGAIKDASAYGGDALKTGLIPNVAGFAAHASTSIPANSENLVGFAAYKSALLIAARALKAPEDATNVISETYVDARTGVRFEYRQWYEPTALRTVAGLFCMFGATVGEAAALKRIVSA